MSEIEYQFPSAKDLLYYVVTALAFEGTGVTAGRRPFFCSRLYLTAGRSRHKIDTIYILFHTWNGYCRYEITAVPGTLNNTLSKSPKYACMCV